MLGRDARLGGTPELANRGRNGVPMPESHEFSPRRQPDPPAAHWPNPANEYDAGAQSQRAVSDETDDAVRLEQTDPKDLRSAAPADGTGVTGTVKPS